MLSIRTNLSNLIAQNNLLANSNKLNQAIERMTTGAKLNHAKDNAANYSIATNITTKMGALRVAEDNALQGLEMVNTALSTLSEITNSVTRLKELSMILHNDTYGESSKDIINQEAKQIINNIYRVKNNANYNNISLFGGIERAVNPDFNGGESQSKYKFIEEVTRVDTTLLPTIESLDENVTITGGSYSVSSPEEIEKALSMISAGTLSSVELVLANDVDYSEYTGIHTKVDWVNFNGNGFIIKNFVSTKGFFSSGTVENLGLENVNISATSDKTGGILDSNGTLINCYVTGKITSSKNFVGGLIGWSKWCRIENCFADVEVRGGHSVGALVGYVDANGNSKIERSSSIGKVIGSHLVGGLVGSYSTNTHMTGSITNCASAAYVEGEKNNAGGLIGSLWAPGTNFTLENCYSIGLIESSGSEIGGLIGAFNVANEINNCYYLKETSGCSDKGKGVGVNVTELFTLIDSSTLTDYDFDLPLPDIYDEPSDNLYSPSSLNFQLGMTAESSAGIFIDLTFKMDGLKNLCYLGLIHETSLENLDKMLISIADKETELGALLNRFESALDEISIQYENLVSSRSTIRDADIAEVSSQYIQQQILQQASATLLSSAQNVQAQNVLGLLQSLRR